MEQLTKIKIEGFRSLRSLDLALDPLNIFIGANGAGKSNLIEFFTMLNFALTGSLQLYVARKGGTQAILHYGAKRTPVLHGQLEFTGPQATSRYRFTLAHSTGDRFVYTDEQVEYLSASRERPFSDSLGVGHTESKLLPLAKSSGTGARQTVARVFVNRLKEVQAYHFHDTSDESMLRSYQDVNLNHILLNHGGNLASFLYALQETKPEHFERIIHTFQTIVPYVRNLVLRPDVLNPGRILLRWRDRNPDYEFGAHQLSDGSMRALALVTALLQPEETMPGIILLDEPELGLHPAGIAIVASLIRSVSKTRQIIVSTQSPRFLAEFEPEQVVVVERQEDDLGYGESVFTRLDSESLRGWLEDYDLGTLYEMQVTGGAPQ